MRDFKIFRLRAIMSLIFRTVDRTFNPRAKQILAIQHEKIVEHICHLTETSIF